MSPERYMRRYAWDDFSLHAVSCFLHGIAPLAPLYASAMAAFGGADHGAPRSSQQRSAPRVTKPKANRKRGNQQIDPASYRGGITGSPYSWFRGLEGTKYSFLSPNASITEIRAALRS